MQKDQLKLVFMGTPEFSAKILEGIINDGYNVIGVITEPDKPVGRSQELVPTPVKALATSFSISVHQPANKEELRIMNQELSYDLGVVAAYGKILPKEVLEKPKYGCINFHGSLLPKLRGASPIQSAILQGLDKTGVVIMKLDEGMDTGSILTQVEILLDNKETTTTLREKMLEYGLPLLLNTIPGYINGEIKPRDQVGEATLTKIIKKEDGKIDFSKSAVEEERKLRAFNEWPGVYSFWEGKRVKFIEVDNNFQFSIFNFQSISNDQFSKKEIGEVFLGDDKLLCIKFRDGIWVINKLQIEGGKPVSVKDFINGNKDFVGAILK